MMNITDENIAAQKCTPLAQRLNRKQEHNQFKEHKHFMVIFRSFYIWHKCPNIVLKRIETQQGQ